MEPKQKQYPVVDVTGDKSKVQFALIHGPNIPGPYAILLFTASDLASITSHIHSWGLFLFWLSLFILSGAISPLISSSILGTYQPGEFIFPCHIYLLFQTVHGVLQARLLKWLAIPFSSGPHSVRSLHPDPPVLVCMSFSSLFVCLFQIKSHCNWTCC